jgi:hypothetical protein
MLKRKKPEQQPKPSWSMHQIETQLNESSKKHTMYRQQDILVSKQPYTKSKEIINGNRCTKTSPIILMDVLYAKGQNPIMPNGMHHSIQYLPLIDHGKQY